MVLIYHKISFIKMPVLPKFIYSFHAILIKISAGVFVKFGAMIRNIVCFEGHRKVKTILENINIFGNLNTNFKTC